MVGSTISAKAGGSHITGSPVTDTSITAAGYAGLRSRQGGQIKELTAVNLAAGSSTSFTATTDDVVFSGGSFSGTTSATGDAETRPRNVSLTPIIKT
jgi:hypothetical protein